MVFLVLTWKQGVTDIQLVKNATKAPHIDGCSVRYSKNNLWCTIKARLDVGVYLFVFKAATSKVDDFDS